jgi:hypothetical protein
MDKTLPPLVALGFAVCAGSALAEQPVPSMNFLSIPSVEQVTPAGAQLLQFRSADRTVVIFKQPSDCGARLADPTFEVKPGALHIGYSLPSGTAASSSARCEATGIFTFKNLPQDNLQIVADIQTTAAVPQPELATASPTMAFLSVPASPESSAGPPKVLQFRHQGEIVVIAKQWAQCGQRPTDPSINLGGGTLHVSYGIAGGESTSAGQECVAGGIFTVKGLPDEAVTVAADTHRVAALARAPEPGPSMTFLSVPAIAQPNTIQPMLLQYRHGREMVAIVTQRSECGQRPADPSFEVTGAIANLGYRVPAGDTCMATGIFALKDLPERNLIVSAHVNGEPAQLLCLSYGDSRRGSC